MCCYKSNSSIYAFPDSKMYLVISVHTDCEDHSGCVFVVNMDHGGS